MTDKKPNPLLSNGTLTSEFFYIEIKQVLQQNKIWDDSGTGAKNDVAFWDIKPSSGFYAFGHIATRFHEIQNDKGLRAPFSITLKPKPGYENLLTEPVDYEEVWSDAGTGKEDGDCNIWKMICPEGYVSLGDVITTNRQKPKTGSSFRCIRKTAINAVGQTVSLVTRAAYVDHAKEGTTTPVALWTDHGTEVGDQSVSIWSTSVNSRPATRNQVYLGAGTFKSGKHHEIVPYETAYALALNFPEDDIREEVKMERVKLNGPRLPTLAEMMASKVEQEYYVPFFGVKDPEYPNQLEQFIVSPTYKIRRTTLYEAIDAFAPINTETKEHSITIGRSTETNYNKEVGVTLGLSVEVGGEAGLPVASTSVKVTASVEASYNYSWGGATTEAEEESFTYTQTVTGGCYGVLFQAKSTYTIYRENGSEVGAPITTKNKEFYTDEWRPDGVKPDGDEKPSSPNTIVFTIEAPPGKTIILEGRLEIRDGQLTSMPSVLSIPAINTSLLQKTLRFDTTTQPVNVPIAFSRSYTKEAWIKVPKQNKSGFNNIISGGGAGQHAFTLVDGNKICSGHNGNWSYVLCNEAVSEDWEHYAVTYDADKQEMSLYKNGKLVSYRRSVPPYNGGNFVQIGAYEKNTNIFVGEMAEVRIWDMVRTEEQIASDMNLVLPVKTTGLLTKFPN